MKARGGFTLVELLLAGAILATISFGALVGTMRMQKLVNDRSDLMAVDGYCWDVAWKLFNDDLDGPKSLKMLLDAAHAQGCRACEIKGRVLPIEKQTQGSRRYEFLSHLQFKDSPPVCYITLSNICDSAGNEIESGICIGVNLEWGPKGHRSILTPRSGMALSDDIKTVYDHPIAVFKCDLPRHGRHE